MPIYTVPLAEVDRSRAGEVGGKAANLGEMYRTGLQVPDGFCLTIHAFSCFLESVGDLDALLGSLSGLAEDKPDELAIAGSRVRRALRSHSVPGPVREALLHGWRTAGGQDHAFAVRSSATAEDLVEASFAGQHDTYLQVRSEAELLNAVRNCWISLYTDRAIGYRIRHGFDHREVKIGVVIQRMVDATVSGVMFTADPVSGDRRPVLINAAYGLGEAVVSGIVNPDLYRVGQDGRITHSVAAKEVEVIPASSGGVIHADVDGPRQHAQALPDADIRRLAELGRRIEAYFGSPQDIEWAWDGKSLYVLQARPITSLFPIPARTGSHLRVYFSFGHQQMMTDAISPLGVSILRTFFPFGSRLADDECPLLAEAGGRLYFDYTDPLHSPLSRQILCRAAGAMDARVGDALFEITLRPGFRIGYRLDLRRELKINVFVVKMLALVVRDLCFGDMEHRAKQLRKFADQTVATSSRAMLGRTGSEVIRAIQDELMTVPLQMFFRMTLTQVTAMVSRNVLQRLCARWIGRIDISDLHKALPDNIAAELGTRIGDLGDIARRDPDLVGLLQSPPANFQLADLESTPAGPVFAKELSAFLDQFGMRGPGEVDIARVRWRDDPTLLFPAILANLRSGVHGEHRRRQAAAEQDAREAAERIARELRSQPWGWVKARLVTRLITVYRTLMGQRESQKFMSVRLFDVYKLAIRREAGKLVEAGILASAEDVNFLSLSELADVLAGRPSGGLAETIASRRLQYLAASRLTPPRLFTSDGEIVNGRHRAAARDGVLVGCPVSGGIAQGQARVVLRPQDATLSEGDILIAPSTDPAWTPLFAAVKGIVLEIGGMMTHGAVVAREMGIPTVVGIDKATSLIQDGWTVRVDGSAGEVEVLAAPAG